MLIEQRGERAQMAHPYDKHGLMMVCSANFIAKEFLHGAIHPEHLLMGATQTSQAGIMLAEMGITAQKVHTAIENILGRGYQGTELPYYLSFARKSVNALDLTRKDVIESERHRISDYDMVIGLSYIDGIHAGVIEGLGLSMQDVRNEALERRAK